MDLSLLRSGGAEECGYVLPADHAPAPEHVASSRGRIATALHHCQQHFNLTMYLQRSTWQALGLSVGAGYLVLGTCAVVWPRQAASTFFNVGNPADAVEWAVLGKSPAQLSLDAMSSSTVDSLMPLLGARDLSFAAAIFALAYQNSYRDVGTVILAGMGLSLADVVCTWNRRGPEM